MNKHNPNRRWRFQFSLRIVFAVMLGVALGFPLGVARTKVRELFRSRKPAMVMVQMQVVELRAGELRNLPTDWDESLSDVRYVNDSDESTSTAIKSLVQKKRATILSRPQLMMRCGQPAFVSFGTGTTIEVMSTLVRGGSIALGIRSQIADSTSDVYRIGKTMSGRGEHRIDAIVEANSGETVVIAGRKISTSLVGSNADSDVVIIFTPHVIVE